MRNCFIPLCDFKNKDLTKRMMFQPPKEESLFQLWKDILPKKREFQKKDKVCELHFDPADIERVWEHTINGQKVLMERGKPRLKKTAKPTHNLPTEDEYNKIKRRAAVLPSQPKKLRKVQDKKVIIEIINNQRLQNVTLQPRQLQFNKDYKEEFVIKPVDSVEEIVLPDDQQDEENEHELEKFEALYDDIFEVVLPSTLWGIHRDPDKNFIVFSEFNEKCMSTLKTVYIDNKFKYNFFLRSHLVMGNKIEDTSTDHVSKMLADFDDYKVCLKLLETVNAIDMGCMGLINTDEGSEKALQIYCDECAHN